VIFESTALSAISTAIPQCGAGDRQGEGVTWVRLSPNDALTGFTNVDNIETLSKDELGEYLVALTPATMDRINAALAVALGLPSPYEAQLR
jgi:mRNA-degrading endonuclease toxin of MazEF toxin-antitoxin module